MKEPGQGQVTQENVGQSLSEIMAVKVSAPSVLKGQDIGTPFHLEVNVSQEIQIVIAK
jgi:hypothetical protein